MIKGQAQFKQRLAEIPGIIRAEVRTQLEKEAGKLVKEMEAIKPIPEIEIGWTWGEPPRGALSLGNVKEKKRSEVQITIYAVAPQGSGFNASWFEFGTQDRFHKSGKYTGRLTETPFFWPVYRSNKTRVVRNVRAAVKRGFQKA